MAHMTKAQLVDEIIALLEQQVADLANQLVAAKGAANTFAHRPARVFHVVAGKYDGDGENCKFSDTRYTLEEAEALLLTVSDYPWSRIEAV